MAIKRYKVKVPLTIEFVFDINDEEWFVPVNRGVEWAKEIIEKSLQNTNMKPKFDFGKIEAKEIKPTIKPEIIITKNEQPSETV